VIGLIGCLCVVCIRNLMPVEPGDASTTGADASLLKTLIGSTPRTDVRMRVKAFVE